MNPSKACPSLDQLQRFLQDKHDDAHSSEIGQHIETCHDCESVVEDLLKDENVEKWRRLYQVGFFTNSGQVDAATIALPPSASTRFQPQRLLDKGGLGEVFVAHDSELDREVALKRIQERHADDQINRSRFLQEAAITARLEHPGIVPVYSLGADSKANPYYAMRLIRGDTLKVHIDDFYATNRPVSASADSSIEFRRLLGQFVAVCQTMEYAHSRGVIHRDLKPANVMVGSFGETLVVDWGLAKVMSRANTDNKSNFRSETAQSARVDSDAEDTLEARSQFDIATANEHTAVGTVVGTPAYMAPEQALGKTSELGPRTDVFALGAMLFHILTGSGPSRRNPRDRAAISEFSASGFPPRPRDRNPKVPRALEAICVKAMSNNPQDRYAGPRELAREIERWLADDSVQAWPEPWHVRANRWARRHRTILYSAAAALVVATVGLILGVVAVTQKNGELRAANSRTQQVVNEFFTEVSESDELLRGSPGTQRLRSRLLQKARDYYQNYLRDNKQTAMSHELAQANIRLGISQSAIGTTTQAEQSFRNAIDVCEKEVDSLPMTRSALAAAHHNLANLLFDTGRVEEAHAHSESSIRIYQDLLEEDSTNPEMADRLAKSYANHASRLLAAGLLSQAEAAYLRALSTFGGIKFAAAHEMHRDSHLAMLHGNMFSLYLKQGNTTKASTHFQQAHDLYERAIKRRSDQPDLQAGLAKLVFDQGKLLLSQRDYSGASEHLGRVIQMYQVVIDQNPSVVDYARRQSHAYLTLANLQADTGRIDDSIDSTQQGVLILAQASRRAPESARCRADLAAAHTALGYKFYVSRKLESADEEFKTAIDIHRDLLDNKLLDLHEQESKLALAIANQGLVYRAQGNFRAYLDRLNEATDIHRKLMVGFPDVPEHRNNLSGLYHARALLLATCRQDEIRNGTQALSDATQACELTQWKVPEYLESLAAAYAELGQFDKAVECQSKAIEILAGASRTSLENYNKGIPRRN